MKLLISLEQLYEMTPDGRIWTNSGGDQVFWHRYLDVFDSVEIVARVKSVVKNSKDSQLASGKGINFIALPYYIGPFQYVCRSLEIDRIVKRGVRNAQAILLRVPGQVSNVVFRHIKKNHHPYAVEVVGDPRDVFAPGAVAHPFRSFFRWWGVRQLRNQCWLAVAWRRLKNVNSWPHLKHAGFSFV
jgi:hypothetical protein